MYKVGIIGPESTGKSTLARELAEQFKGTYVPEYAREYVERKGSTEVTYDELCGIARHQIEEITSLPFREEPEVGFHSLIALIIGATFIKFGLAPAINVIFMIIKLKV